MIDKNNKYTQMQIDFYKNGTSNHLEHNKNPDYWNILLKYAKFEENKDKRALDFGCGKGRNVSNLKLFFDKVDGVDISKENIKYCQENISNSLFYVNNGVDVSEIPNNQYDFVMSTICFQHIPVHDIRYSLMKDIYRVMKNKSVFSFQMSYGDSLDGLASYYENRYDVYGTNGLNDVRITNKQDIIDDLTKIGFYVWNIEIKPSFSDFQHPKWVYVHCVKVKNEE